MTVIVGFQMLFGSFNVIEGDGPCLLVSRRSSIVPERRCLEKARLLDARKPNKANGLQGTSTTPSM